MGDKLVEFISLIAKRLALDFTYGLSAVLETCESPIEKALLLALISEVSASPGIEEGEFPAPCGESRGGFASPYMLFFVFESTRIATQVPVVINRRKYRLDLVVNVKSTWIAVECDGHDFHEKTKRQAQADKQRDRDLQEAGYLVARFTGSEIYQDPKNAAHSIYRLLFSRKAT